MALLEHIGRGIDESAHMPSREAMGEMEDAKVVHCYRYHVANRHLLLTLDAPLFYLHRTLILIVVTLTVIEMVSYTPCPTHHIL